MQSPSEYVLTLLVLGDVPELKLSRDNYDTIVMAHDILYSGLAIEQKYEIIVRNSVHFENTLHELSLEFMVRGFMDQDGVSNLILELNVIMANLLTSTRMYHDQLTRDLGICIQNRNEASDLVKQLTSQEDYDSQAYRFMSALRNYVQHYDLPVHWMRQGAQNLTFSDEEFTEFTLDFGSYKRNLMQDRRFDTEVLKEQSDEIDLKVFTRKYIESISTIHGEIRNIIADSVNNAASTVITAIQKYTDIFERDGATVFACEKCGQKIIERIPLIDWWEEARQKYIRNNMRISNLGRSYVSTTVNNDPSNKC